MVNGTPTDRLQKLERFRQHLAAARKLQDDILKYGLEAAHLYFEDVDGDWLEKWGEDEEEQRSFVELVTTFLQTDDWLAVRLRKQLPDKDVAEIATKLEKYWNFPQEDQINGLSNFLAGRVMSIRVYENASDVYDLEIQHLAAETIKKLAEIFEKT
ncbi:MAG: hypothetical protein KME23_19070 [Goleter apudmare HA4340-LM2]|jgi:hypothetical protein|nr:hypothetical protein [Goleter apudmare HA4340-LM2]